MSEKTLILTKRRNVPTLKKPEPIMGIIREILFRELHPKQKRQMGMKSEPRQTSQLKESFK
jgi:hypothetical protein